MKYLVMIKMKIIVARAEELLEHSTTDTKKKYGRNKNQVWLNLFWILDFPYAIDRQNWLDL